MSKFNECFETPLVMWDGEWAISRELYTKEEAAKLISDEMMSYSSLGFTRDWNVKLPLDPDEELFVSHVKYRGDWIDGEWVTGWYITDITLDEKSMKNAKPIWITRAFRCVKYEDAEKYGTEYVKSR